MSTQQTNAKKGAVSTFFLTKKVRLSYSSIWEAKSMLDEKGNPTGTPKFAAQLLIPKTDTVTVERIKTAFKAAVELGKSKKWNGEVPDTVKLSKVLKDGDKPNNNGKLNEAAKNCWYISASAVTKPNVIDLDEVKITDQAKVYSGCFIRASINLFPYNFKGMSKGIGVGLNNIQKLSEGEPLGGRNTAEYDFSLEAYDDEETTETQSNDDSDDFMN